MAKQKKEDVLNDGVGFVIEELALLGTSQGKEAIHTIWMDTTVDSFREDIIKTMQKNNPELYKETVKPILEELGKGWDKNSK